MKKIFISEGGSIGFIKDTGSLGLKLEFFKPNGTVDKIVEEFPVDATNEELEGWIKQKPTAKLRNQIRRKKMRQ